MKSQTPKLITTIVATVASGIPIWTVSARDFSMTDPQFLGILALIGVSVTVVAALLSSLQPKDTIGAVTAGFGLAIILRFFGDMFFGTAQHASLGLDLVIALAVGAASAWLGTLVIRIKKENR